MDSTKIGRVDGWRSTLATFLTSATVDAGGPAAAPRKRSARAGGSVDVAERHDRWRVTLAAHAAG